MSTLDSDGCNKYKTEYVQIGGIISNVNLRYDKNGNQWAILSLDTLSGTIQVYVFHNTYLEYLNFINEDKIIFIQGKVSNQSDNNKINQVIANKIHSPEGIRQKLTRKINIRIDYDQTNTQLLESVYQLFNEHKGSYPVMFHMMTSQSRSQKIINKKILVSNDLDFLTKLRSFVGNKNVWLS